MSGAAGTAAGGGGDLSGGSDGERNAQLDQLRKLYAAPAAVDNDSAASEAEEASRLGLLLDLPLVRYSWCHLPHHQIAMSVWQPQYTLMFAKLLSQPPPHYYLHVLLPGGAESLGQPGYELEPGTKSSLVGTLVRVVFARRNPDQTLTLVVQGLCRGVVLPPATQVLPYSRGNVQVLPDAEALRTAAREGLAYAQRTRSQPTPSARRRMVAAAASMEASAWFAYEAVQLSVDAGGAMAPLNQFNASAAAACAAAAPREVQLALEGTPMPPADAAGEEQVDALYNGSVAATWLDAAVVAAAGAAGAEGEEAAAAHGEAVEAVAEESAALEALEVQVWLEVDDLLSTLRASGTAVPLPTQLLGLLPPPPAAGWPEGFGLAAAAERLGASYEPPAENATEAVRPLSYVPADGAYPPRKRAERFSWTVWAVIGDQRVGVNSFGGSPYQKLLEADGTAERLRMARRKLAEIKEKLRG